MGGNVLELETDRIIAESIAKGKLELMTALLQGGMSYEELTSHLNMPMKQELDERIGAIMGGNVLELETDRIIAESIAKGEASGKTSLITTLLQSGMSCEELASRLNMPIEEIKDIEAMI